uniref:Kinesin motor domain-containing protein n=1 Tax=Ascaris lumbricoides TaxID=6252 RepID=A0A0M3HYW4_ASCLU
MTNPLLAIERSTIKLSIVRHPPVQATSTRSMNSANRLDRTNLQKGCNASGFIHAVAHPSESRIKSTILLESSTEKKKLKEAICVVHQGR